MSYSIKQPKVSAQLGAGIGQGLAQQIPEEIKRYRLKSGLQELSKKAADLSPFEQAGELAAIPGITPENMGPFIELLRRQNAAREAKNAYAGGAGGAGAPGQPGQPELNALEQSENPNYLIPLAPEQLRAQAAQLFAEQPNRFPNFEDALAEVTNIDNARVAKDQANEARINLVDARITDAQNQIDRDTKTYGQLDPEIVRAIREKYVKSKAHNPRQAANDASKEVLELSKALTQAKTAASHWPWEKGYGEKVKDLKRLRKRFEKDGYEKQFDDEASANLGVDVITTAGYLDPITGKEIAKAIPKKGIKGYFGKPFGHFGNTGVNMSDKELNKLVDAVVNDKNSNVLSVMDALRERNYDINQFKDALETKRKSLTTKQGEQLDKSVTQRKALGDILFQTFGGKK